MGTAPSVTMFLFGDSIMEGYNSEQLYTFYPKKKTWAHKLSKHYSTTMIAHSGRRIVDGGVKVEFVEALKSVKAGSVVCFELGTNDLAYDKPDVVINNIKEFIELVPKTMKPFYMTHCGIRMHRDTEDEFFNLLTPEAIGCPILDMHQYRERLLGRDGLHYTLEAQDLVAGVVHQFVEKLIGEQ